RCRRDESERAAHFYAVRRSRIGEGEGPLERWHELLNQRFATRKKRRNEKSLTSRISLPTVSHPVHGSRHRAVVDEAGNRSRRSPLAAGATSARAVTAEAGIVRIRSGRR